MPDTSLMSNPNSEGKINLRSPIFYVSPYKAGSTMLFTYAADIFRFLDIRFIDYPTHYHHVHNRLAEFYRKPGTKDLYMDAMCYVGQREVPSGLMNSDWNKSAHILALIRDPRDALVSMYYSFLGSHKPPQCLDDPDKYEKEKNEFMSSVDIDSYVLLASSQYLININNIISFCKTANSYTLLKYEDIIFAKEILVTSIIESLEANSSLSRLYNANRVSIDEITARHDVIPKIEDPGSHIRKATPGDWKNKLKPETSEKLASIFSQDLFEYYPDLSNSTLTIYHSISL